MIEESGKARSAVRFEQRLLVREDFFTWSAPACSMLKDSISWASLVYQRAWVRVWRQPL
jgi:hypothetical protein